MSTRYRITREGQAHSSGQVISLEECKSFFATQADFTHTEQYSFRSAETVMTIPGEFFMWQVGEAQIPFRYFEGDLYVAVSHELIFQKMVEVAEQLQAQFVEG